MPRKNKVKVIAMTKKSEKKDTLENSVRKLRATKVDASFDDGRQLLFWQAWLRKSELPAKDRAWLREADERYFRGTYVLAEEMAKRGIIMYWSNGVRHALPPKVQEEVNAILYSDN